MFSILIVVSFILSTAASFFLLLVENYEVLLPCLTVAVALGVYIFKDSMNVVQHAGRVYWIIRNNGNNTQPRVCMGFMRQTDPPWLRGKGPQVRIGKFIAQVGILSPDLDGGRELLDEETGLLEALGGYMLEETPDKIRRWP